MLDPLTRRTTFFNELCEELSSWPSLAACRSPEGWSARRDAARLRSGLASSSKSHPKEARGRKKKKKKRKKKTKQKKKDEEDSPTF
jgi:hypothetical protein